MPSLRVAYVWHASRFTSEVLAGLLRIGFHHQQIIWDKQRTVLTRTLYWFQHEPCWFVRKKNAPWYGKPGEISTIWSCPSPKFIMNNSKEEKFDRPTQKPVELMRRPILNHTKKGELVYDDGYILMGATDQSSQPGTEGRPVSFPKAEETARALHKEPPQVTVTTLSDSEQLLLATGSKFSRDHSHPG